MNKQEYTKKILLLLKKHNLLNESKIKSFMKEDSGSSSNINWDKIYKDLLADISRMKKIKKKTENISIPTSKIEESKLAEKIVAKVKAKYIQAKRIFDNTENLHQWFSDLNFFSNPSVTDYENGVYDINFTWLLEAEDEDYDADEMFCEGWIEKVLRVKNDEYTPITYESYGIEIYDGFKIK